MKFNRLRRRQFITLLGGAAAWPLAARAQQAGKLPTIGFLGALSPSAASQWTAAFVQRLRELGWIEGRTVAIEYRWMEGRTERAAEFAAEFVRLKVDVIVTHSAEPVIAAKAVVEIGEVQAAARTVGPRSRHIRNPASRGHRPCLRGTQGPRPLAGTAIGHVALDRIIVGEHVREGDAVIGVESNGIHSNGLSLARRAFFETNSYKVSHQFSDLACDLGTELLRPTHIYVGEALELLDRVPSVKALAHITSDGLLNLTRVKADVGYVIDALPAIPPIFSLIQRLEHVNITEMFSVFNMGVGFCAVVAEKDAELAASILGGRGKRAWRIGHAVADSKRRVSLPQYGLVGQGKHFRRADG